MIRQEAIQDQQDIDDAREQKGLKTDARTCIL
jgi:hypothetical protein